MGLYIAFHFKLYGKNVFQSCLKKCLESFTEFATSLIRQKEGRVEIKVQAPEDTISSVVHVKVLLG